MSAMRSMPADAGLLSLQQEALQRVRQMQQRARLAVEGRTGENTPPPSAQAAPAPAPFSPRGASSQPPGAAPAPAPFSPRGASSQPPGAAPAPATLPPQGAAPPNPSMPGGDAQRSGPQQSFRPPNPPPFAGQRPQRSSGAENILSQLFGGTRQQSRRQAPGGPPAPGKQSGANGLLDLIRGGLGGGEAAGLGDSLRGSIASASKPLSDLLDAFSIDGEKLLILLVMWVIFNERSDNKTLLLALGYLLL